MPLEKDQEAHQSSPNKGNLPKVLIFLNTQRSREALQAHSQQKLRHLSLKRLILVAASIQRQQRMVKRAQHSKNEMNQTA